jgi:hypothetical protein
MQLSEQEYSTQQGDGPYKEWATQQASAVIAPWRNRSAGIDGEAFMAASTKECWRRCRGKAAPFSANRQDRFLPGNGAVT